MKNEKKYSLVINHGIEKGFEKHELEKKEFIREISFMLKEPKKIFLGLGDFLEVGDYNQLLDSIFFDKEGVKFENILDRNNRKISEAGNVPFSFFKLAVYFPDFLLKEVPVSCVSMIGEKSRLFPGAEVFIHYIKDYDPVVLSALPYEMAIEFVKRLGLGDGNLISTEYSVKQNESRRDVYAGGVDRFISGDRKSIEIEKYMSRHLLTEDEVLYIGRGEAGTKTFSTVNSIAFNPSSGVMPESRVTLYGSSLESLLVLLNYKGVLEKFLLTESMEDYIPSLVVFSEVKEKSDDLMQLELRNLQLQNNIIGQIIEHSADSYLSVEREINVAFGGSSINMKAVREMISSRMEVYRKNPQELVKKIYGMAKERYKNYCQID